VSYEFKQTYLSPKLIRRSGWCSVATISHWCPACEQVHDFAVEQPFGNGARWSWDGNAQHPTFSPSMNIKIGPWPKGTKREGEVEICHYFLYDGVLKYLTDCTHSMRGQNVVLPDLPYRKVGSDWFLGNTVVEGHPDGKADARP